MRVLVVEDDHISAMVIREILAPLGVAEVAENGLVAVSKFRNALERGESYDCVFLDIMMPNLSGHEALNIIRGKEKERGVPLSKEVKVIMTSAMAPVPTPMNRPQRTHSCQGAVIAVVRALETPTTARAAPPCAGRPSAP